MVTTDLFTPVTLTERVILKPNELTHNLKDIISSKIRDKYEGVCSQFGFIKPGTIDIVEYTPGRIQAISLNGDIIYKTSFTAHVCNPTVGQFIEMVVVTRNRFGVMGECTTEIQGKRVVIMEVVIAKHIHDASEMRDMDLDTLEKGTSVLVRVLGRKMELGDKKICVLVDIVSNADGGHLGVVAEDNEGLSEEGEDAEAVEDAEVEEDVEEDEEAEDDGDEDEVDEEDKQSAGAVDEDVTDSDDSSFVEEEDSEFFDDDEEEVKSDVDSD